MMTGRDLIVYIMSNGLENEPVFKDGAFIGFETIDNFAKRSNVGLATVRTWAQLGMVEYVKLESSLYIPATANVHMTESKTDE